MRSVTSKRFEDTDQGSAGAFDLHAMQVGDPEEFVMIAASAKEIDSLSADDDMGTTQVTLGWRELAALDGSTFHLDLPRLTGDGGEYVVEVEVSVTQPER